MCFWLLEQQLHDPIPRTMEIAMVLGVAQPEEAPSRGARDDSGPSQMQFDGPVALNRSPEVESIDSMPMDDSPTKEPSSQPVASKQQSPASLTDTVVEVQKQLKRKRASNGPVIATADKDAPPGAWWVAPVLQGGIRPEDAA
jgi:chromatin assembly factor 1 subunit A